MSIANYMLQAFLWCISKMPFFLIYRLSDFLYLVIFYVVGYRKKVVMDNLQNSFPDKSEKERRKIMKQYYHNLCDIMLETLKKNGMKEKHYHKRIQVKNWELFNRLYQENKSVIVVVGHCGNFEWIMSYMSLISPHKCYVTVRPIKNKFFDKYTNKARAVFELTPYHHRKTYDMMGENRNERTLTLIGGDQTPTHSKSRYWTRFLNQETAFFTGIEKIAKMYNLAIVFVDIHHTKRGHYQIVADLISDDPQNTKRFEIIESYAQKLETAIIQHPADWLWSHRRWKIKREEEEIIND